MIEDAKRIRPGGFRPKPELTRLPPRALRSVARAIESGDQTYERWDWLERGNEDDARAALGHVFEWLGGKDADTHSGEHPVAHAAARLLFILERIERGHDDADDWRAPR